MRKKYKILLITINHRDNMSNTKIINLLGSSGSRKINDIPWIDL